MLNTNTIDSAASPLVEATCTYTNTIVTSADHHQHLLHTNNNTLKTADAAQTPNEPQQQQQLEHEPSPSRQDQSPARPWPSSRPTSPSLTHQSLHSLTPRKLYPMRFLVLCAVAAGNFINTAVATSFSPVTPSAAVYYGVNEFSINVLYMVYLATYCVVSPFSSWFIDTKGLAKAIQLGALLNVLGVGILFTADFLDTTNICFDLTLLGQIVLSAAQPFYFNVPPKVSARWFPPVQRTVTSSIMSLTQPLGSAMVFGLGPGVVDGTRSSFKIYHGILLVLALFLSIPSAFCTRDAPETAPSASAVAPHENFAQGMRKLLGGGSRAYFVLLVAGGVNVGILNCFTALISDLLGPYGYSQADAGNVGIVNVGVGLVCAGILCYIADKRQLHGPILVACCMVTSIGVFMVYFALAPGMLALMYTSNALIGMGLFATIPICMELAVEVTFPVCEGTSNGFLQITGNFIAIVLIVLSNLFRGSGDFRNAALLLGSVSLCALTSALLFKNEKKREVEDIMGSAEDVPL